MVLGKQNFRGSDDREVITVSAVLSRVVQRLEPSSPKAFAAGNCVKKGSGNELALGH